MATLFTVLFVMENILIIIGIVAHLPDPATFKPIFLLKYLPKSFAYFGLVLFRFPSFITRSDPPLEPRLSNMVVQLIIMILTIHKYRKERWRTIPIAKLVLRDGTAAFFTISSMSSISFIRSRVRRG